MMMLIIFLITDISMVGIFAGVYGNIAKYGMRYTSITNGWSKRSR